MATPRIGQQRSDQSSIGSEDAVAVATRAQLDALEVAELAKAPATTRSDSVIPGRAGLNDPGGVNALVILEAAAENAFQEEGKARPLVSIPTADLISHSSFKSDSKFVIRIVPSPDNKSRDRGVVTQVEQDQQMFFDRASLQTTSEVHEERYQLFEAFDGETLFLFGERPKIWNFQFVVMNGARPRIPLALQRPGAEIERAEFMRRWNMDFTDELLRRYDRYYRGQAALRLRARTYLSYEDTLIEATLVGMVASRNNSIPGAANVGITFVVHQRQLLGEDLVFGGDATLSALLASDDQRKLVERNISPSTIVPRLRTVDQIRADYVENQELSQQSQAKATELQAQQAIVVAQGQQANARAAELNDQKLFLAALVQNETDPEAKAILSQQLVQVQADLATATADAQEAQAAATQGQEELTAASAANDLAQSRQGHLDAQLRNSVDGNQVSNAAVVAFFVKILSTADDGVTRILTTWRVAGREQARALAQGASPESQGAELLSTEAVIETQPDGAIIIEESTST